MSSGKCFPLHGGSAFAPSIEHVEQRLHRALLSPQSKDGAGDFPIQVHSVVIQIHGCSSAVVFAACMNGDRVTKAPEVFGKCLLLEGTGRNSFEEPGFEVELGIAANQGFWKGRRLDQKEPMPVRCRKLLCHAVKKDAVSRNRSSPSAVAFFIKARRVLLNISGSSVDTHIPPRRNGR